MKHAFEWMKRSGILLGSLASGIGLYLWWIYTDRAREGGILCIAVGVLITLYISTQNRIRRKYGQPEEELGTVSGLTIGPSEYLAQSGREKHLRPPVPKRMLFKEPTGFCFGMYDGKYVCRAPDDPGAILINGGSGSGKSSAAIIPYLLLQQEKHEMNSLVIDIKHELSDITRRPGDGSYIVDPLDRGSYGIDPFWALNEHSSNQEIFEVCQVIAISIIPPMSGDKVFWVDSARALLTGALLYCYKQKQSRNLTDIIQWILSKPVDKTVEEIVTIASPGSDEYMSVVDFHGMAAETLSSVFANLKNKILPLVTDKNLAFALGDGGRKYRPDMLRTGSVYICIPEHKLEQYSQLVMLVLNTLFLWALELPEKSKDPGRKPMAVVIDETVALLSGVGGKLAMLPQALRVLRSKGVMTVICVQSIPGLKCAYSEDEVLDLLSNLPYKLFFDATTVETQKMVSDWCGTYRRRNTSWSGQDKGGRSTSVQYTDEPIVRPEDLITLAGTEECILVSNIAGYSRVRKVPYYKTPYFKRLWEKTQALQKKGGR